MRTDASAAQIDSLERALLPTSAGAVSTSINFGADASVAGQQMWVESPDANRRSIQTYYAK